MDMFFGQYDGDLCHRPGTANTPGPFAARVIVIREPSVVAIDKNDERILPSASSQAHVGPYLGNIVAVRPLKDGVIADSR